MKSIILALVPCAMSLVLRGGPPAAAAPAAAVAAEPAVRHERSPADLPVESYTLQNGAAKEDYSANEWRSRDNAEVYDNDLHGEKPEPFRTHDIFQNGVDMSWHVAKHKLTHNVRDLRSSGEVDDGLRMGSTFGEDPEESGRHAFPDDMPLTSKWNPVPPSYRPLFPVGHQLDNNIYDPHTGTGAVYDATDEQADPDALKGPKPLPNAAQASATVLGGTVPVSIQGLNHVSPTTKAWGGATAAH